jgi:hypothetical protein
MTKEEMESCLDTIGVYRSVLSFMNVANKDSREDRDIHIENLDKLEEMLRTEAIPTDWMEKRIEYYKGQNSWYTAKLAILEWRDKQEGRYVPGD